MHTHVLSLSLSLSHTHTHILTADTETPAQSSLTHTHCHRLWSLLVIYYYRRHWSSLVSVLQCHRQWRSLVTYCSCDPLSETVEFTAVVVYCACGLFRSFWTVSYFVPSQPQGITSGLNANFNLSPIHSTSHYTTSVCFCFFSKPQLKFYPQFWMQNQKNNNTCFGAYLHSASIQHGNLQPAEWPILFCGHAQEPVFATANRKNSGEVLEKTEGEWTGRVEISKGEIPGSKRSMYGYILTYPRL